MTKTFEQLIKETPKADVGYVKILKICGIYKITSPSNRVYIGQSIDINNRKTNYKQFRYQTKSQIKLYRSLLKYGWENHCFEIIEECTIEMLNERERYWQDYYDVLSKKGLNCILTQTKTLKRLACFETREKISNSAKKRVFNGTNNPPPPPMKGTENPMYGKKHNIDSINKMKKNRIIKKGENHHNSSIFLDVETGIFYFSVREVAEVLNKKFNYIADRIYGKVKKNNLKIIKV